VIIAKLSVSVEGKPVVKDLSLTIMPGTVHALMGLNRSGKSSLASVIMGHPSYAITGGSIDWQGVDVAILEPYERARKGLFFGGAISSCYTRCPD
jgi:Fe-S cluster assembly ATP-binding protein